MNDKAKHLIAAMREDAKWAHGNEWETPIMLGDNLEAAADMIESLEEELETVRRQLEQANKAEAKMSELFDTSSKAIAKVCAERDAWRHRCEAAEMDIRRMLPPGNESCRYCDKFTKIECTWESCPEIAAWRGPCAENGDGGDENSCCL